MSGIDWAPIIESLLAPLAMAAGLAVAVLIYRWARTRLSADEEAFLRYAAEQAVLYAEELGRAGVRGADKMKLAADAFHRILGRHRVRRPDHADTRTRILAALESLRGEGLIRDGVDDDALAEALARLLAADKADDDHGPNGGAPHA